MAIKNLLVTARQSITYLWITITSETSRLTLRTMSKIKTTLRQIQLHALKFWGITLEKSQCFQLSKIIVATDLMGGFVQKDTSDSYNIVKRVPSGTIA